MNELIIYPFLLKITTKKYLRNLTVKKYLKNKGQKVFGKYIKENSTPPPSINSHQARLTLRKITWNVILRTYFYVT